MLIEDNKGFFKGQNILAVYKIIKLLFFNNMYKFELNRFAKTLFTRIIRIVCLEKKFDYSQLTR